MFVAQAVYLKIQNYIWIIFLNVIKRVYHVLKNYNKNNELSSKVTVFINILYSIYKSWLENYSVSTVLMIWKLYVYAYILLKNYKLKLYIHNGKALYLYKAISWHLRFFCQQTSHIKQAQGCSSTSVSMFICMDCCFNILYCSLMWLPIWMSFNNHSNTLQEM
jgi:hypothetical protein